MKPPDTAAPGDGELFAALPVAVVLIDATDRIRRANAAAEEMLNLSERVMLGRPLGELVSPPREAQNRDGQGVAVFDTEVSTSRGRLRLDFASAGLAERPGWRIITLHAAASARRLGHSTDRLAGARAAVGAAAMLAHEIKNPLSGIRGAAQLLAAEADGELTGLITAEVDRIAALIDRMEDFTDTRPLPTGPENVYPLLARARTLAAAGFGRGTPIEERFDPSLPPVLANRDALLQILLNLLKNASEATTTVAEPRIVLATAYRHGMAVSAAAGRPRRALPIEVAVIDNGPGAPADIADHLFEPFVSGRPEGKGLGLALVDKLARDMGGIVQYAREGSPEMTVFRLFLPRAEA